MLAEIQKDFLTALTDKESEPQFLKHIRHKGRITAAKRFDIYTGSIIESLAKTLRHTYKTIESIVGEEFFNGLAYQFIRETPSTSPDLGDYGAEFAGFVGDFDSAKELPYLADVCHLCWMRHCADRTLEKSKHNLQELANVPEEQQEQVIFLLPPSAHLLESPYPIDRIFQMCQQDNDETVDLDDGGVKLLIWKDDQQGIQMDVLNEEEWIVANLLNKKMTLEALHDELSLKHKAIDLEQLLPEFFIKVPGTRFMFLIKEGG
ncbi:MAG: DNA-binding domain-containing protein [Gammaproteobacteria bacterium]|nr:DNA-binding domain-containing protein [Gammaproteobacteria bacterium]